MPFSVVVRHFFHPQRSNNHRPKLLHPDVLFSLALIIIGSWLCLRQMIAWGSHFGVVLGYATHITASDVVTATNQERAAHAAAPLTVNDKLNQAALAKAQYMFAHDYWAHVAPDGTEPWFFFRQAAYEYRLAGENLARDFAVTSDMMTAWMNSPSHRKNVLDNRYQEIGVAVVNGELQGTETTLVVQLFGAPAESAPGIPAAAAIDVIPTPEPSSTQVTFVQELVAPSSIPAVLASMVVPKSALHPPVLLSPLHLSKVFFLLIIMIIVSTLAYDMFVMHHLLAMRLVGKNLAHMLLFFVTALLLLLFKGGMIT